MRPRRFVGTSSITVGVFDLSVIGRSAVVGLISVASNPLTACIGLPMHGLNQGIFPMIGGGRGRLASILQWADGGAVLAHQDGDSRHRERHSAERQ